MPLYCKTFTHLNLKWKGPRLSFARSDLRQLSEVTHLHEMLVNIAKWSCYKIAK